MFSFYRQNKKGTAKKKNGKKFDPSPQAFATPDILTKLSRPRFELEED